MAQGPRPRIRLGLVALILFAPLLDGGTTYVPATLIRLGALALAAAWLLHACRAGSWRRPTPLDLPVLLFMTLAALSTAASSNRYESLQAFLGLATGALVLAVAAEVGRDRESVHVVAGAVVVGGIAQALLALAQWAGGLERPAGTYFNPNFLAAALAMTGALALAARPAGRALAAGAFAVVGLASAALVVTQSRGGLVAAAAAWGVLGWRRWRWRAAAIAAALVTALVLVPNPVAHRLRYLQQHDPLAYTRLEIWQSAIARAADHPFGVGLNLFARSSQRYAFPVEGEIARYGRRAESAHNEYLQILAEMGPLGLALALWALGALARAARRAIPREGPVVLGSAGALMALAVQAVVDVPLAVPGLVVSAAALAGMLVAGRDEPGTAAAIAPGTAGQAAPGHVRLALVALVLLAAAGIARHGLGYFAYERAGVARNAGDLEAARVWLERAAWFAPDSGRYPDALAAASVRAWRLSLDPRDAVAAEQQMRRAMALDPDDAGRYARLAQVYRHVTPADPAVRRVALEEARAMYERAERLDPHTALYAFERAEVLLLLDDRAGAVAALERAVGLEPRFLPARLNLARLLTAQGARKAAAVQYAAIEATLAAYDRPEARAGAGPLLGAYLGVDRDAVRREAASLAGEAG